MNHLDVQPIRSGNLHSCSNVDSSNTNNLNRSIGLVQLSLALSFWLRGYLPLRLLPLLIVCRWCLVVAANLWLQSNLRLIFSGGRPQSAKSISARRLYGLAPITRRQRGPRERERERDRKTRFPGRDGTGQDRTSRANCSFWHHNISVDEIPKATPTLFAPSLGVWWWWLWWIAHCVCCLFLAAALRITCWSAGP